MCRSWLGDCPVREDHWEDQGVVGGPEDGALEERKELQRFGVTSGKK